MKKPIIVAVWILTSVAAFGLGWSLRPQIASHKNDSDPSTVARTLKPSTSARPTKASTKTAKEEESVIADYLVSRQLNELTAFIATHYDADHIGGMVTKTTSDARNHWGQRMQDGPNGIKGDGDDITVAMVVDRGDKNTPANMSITLQRYFEYANAHVNHVTIDTNAELRDFTIDLGDGAIFKVIQVQCGSGLVN